MAEIHEIIRSHSRPLQPRPTGWPANLHSLPGIRAVLFDVYGTLFISASGDVGAGDPGVQAEAFTAALQAVGIEYSGTGREGLERYLDEIRREHERLRDAGVDFPEVDIREIWKRTLHRLAEGSKLKVQSSNSTIESSKQRANPAGTSNLRPSTFNLQLFKTLAVHFEVRCNPVWPMPGCRECLARLQGAGLLLGLVSNAQFFTPALFPALLGGDLGKLGFDPALRLLSFEHRRAKPGLFLYETAAAELRKRSIRPEQTLYVGNDVLNDVAPAQTVGFRTALFAGDERSFRPRTGDGRVARIEPDLVVTELRQVAECLFERSVGH